MNPSLHIEMTKSKGNQVTSVIEKYGQQIFGFLRNKLGNTQDAEDILQEVWIQTSNVTNLHDIQNISSWLYAVARNKVIDSYRKKKTDSLEDYLASEKEDQGSFGSSFREILLIDEEAQPELAFFKELFWKELMEGLDELPESQKEVFVLNELEDFTLQQIADQKSESIKTITSRKGYAVKYLRKKMNYLHQELNN
jgi:RNA polymerase sigma factor (sigma-70 family)